MRRVVVVGGGFCGLNAVLSLQEALRERRHVELVLVDPATSFLFTPMLSGVVTGKMRSHRAASSLRDLVDTGQVDLIQERVEGIDSAAQRISLAGRSKPLGYDSLVISVGATARNWPGQDSHPGAVHVPRTLRGALGLRKELLQASEDHRHMVIVGGGCVGVELAGSLAMAVASSRKGTPEGIRVTLLEERGRLLDDMHPSLSAEAYRALTAAGVDVRLGHRVEHIDPGRVYVESTPTVTDAELEADQIVWAGGVRAPAFLDESGFAVKADGAMRVDAELRAAGHGEVYAGGDVAFVELGTDDDEALPRRRIDVALQHARVIADNVLAGTIGRTRRAWEPTLGTEVVNLGGGRVSAVVKGVPLQGRLASGVWHATLAAMAPSLAQRVSVAAQAGGSLLDGAARWLAERAARSRDRE